MSNVHINNFGGNYGFYNQEESKPQEKAQEVKEEAVVNNIETVKPEEVLNALDLLGVQNMAQISKPQINPADFLSDERIASIEDSMKIFEQGVEKFAGAIQQEFGDAFSEDTINALAAEAFSKIA